MPEEEIGRLTFALFEELRDRHLEQHRLQMLYAGVIAAEIWNSSPYRGENPKHVSPLDFVPTEKQPQPKKNAQSLDELIAEASRAFGCGPGMN